MTWRELIKATLQDLRIYGAVGNVSPDDEAAAQLRLNDWIDQLKTDGRAVYEMVRQTWNLTAAASYAVGSGLAVDVPRPVSPQMIAGVGYIDTGLASLPEFGVQPPLNPSEWQSITYKSFTAPYPARWFYEATVTSGTLYPYPIPSTGGLKGVIYAAQQVAEVTQLANAIALPPGYRIWIRKALKIELRDLFKVPVSDETLMVWMKERDDAAAFVGRQNERLEEVSFGLAGRMFGRHGGPGNIYTGQ